MKVQGNGQSAILSQEQLNLLFTKGLKRSRDKALFGICFYSACRISEALHLKVSDFSDTHITFRKSITKGKSLTREVRIIQPLKSILSEYHPRTELLFPGRCSSEKVLSRNAADRILRQACKDLSIQGASTHSFRRTALTTMSNAGIPLRTIQKISGHTSLEVLQRYLEVNDEQLYQAAMTLSF